MSRLRILAATSAAFIGSTRRAGARSGRGTAWKRSTTTVARFISASQLIRLELGKGVEAALGRLKHDPGDADQDGQGMAVMRQQHDSEA